MKPYRSWRRRAAVALPLALALGLGACSSSDSDGANGAGSAGAAERDEVVEAGSGGVQGALVNDRGEGLSQVQRNAHGKQC